jgi:hypothetical protein
MATIFPSNPVGALPPEVIKIFRFLKSLPDDYYIWHHLAKWEADAPDFLIRSPKNQALLLKVSSASSQEARPAAQLLLLETEQPPLGEKDEQVLLDFLSGLGKNSGEGCPPQIQSTVIFPNIEQKKLKQARPKSTDSAPHKWNIHWWGQENLKTENFLEWTQSINTPPLSESQWEQLRRIFTPEVIVPPTLTVRTAPDRKLAPELTSFLLDYEQETALKTDLSLGGSGEALAQDFRLNLVNGVTGSGKSLILLYRLRLLDELFPGKKFLVLTHNRALIRDLEARFFRLTGREPDNVHWYTFNSWCRENWPDSERWVNPVGIEKRQAVLREVKNQVLPMAQMTTGMLRSEVDWVKDNAINGPDEYLAADRRGRGFALNQGQRVQMFTAIRQYQERLNPRIDWADVPLRMWEFIQKGQVLPQHYDVVLVDEAQFFAPVWFEIIQTLVKPQSGHLFLAADPTQGFLRQGVSWKSLGLEVRGRSYLLKLSYRTTRVILDFATRFYRTRVPEDAEGADILTPALQHMPPGVPPQIIPLTSPQDEISRVANEIAVLIGRGAAWRDILVLHANARGCEQVISAIEGQLGRGAALDPKDSHPGNYVRVTTINAGTGLEAPIVFLMGLNQLFEAENSLRLSEGDRVELVLNNTRKIYMAATRAGQRLVITYIGKIPHVLELAIA